MQELEHWHDIPVSELKEQDLIFNQNKSDLVLALEPLLKHFGFFRPDFFDEGLYAWHLLYDLSSQALRSGGFDWLGVHIGVFNFAEGEKRSRTTRVFHLLFEHF